MATAGSSDRRARLCLARREGAADGFSRADLYFLSARRRSSEDFKTAGERGIYPRFDSRFAPLGRLRSPEKRRSEANVFFAGKIS